MLIKVYTRLHSSRMRTARALTVSPSMLCGEGGCLLREGGVCFRGVGVCSGGGGGCLLRGEGEYLVLGGCLLQGEGGVPGWGCLLWGVYLVPGGVCAGGLYLVLGGVCSQGVSAPGGVCSSGGCTWSGTPPCGQTDACKLITLPQTSFAGRNNSKNSRFVYHVIAKCKAMCFVLEELILHIFFFKYFTSCFFFYNRLECVADYFLMFVVFTI